MRWQLMTKTAFTRGMGTMSCPHGRHAGADPAEAPRRRERGPGMTELLQRALAEIEKLSADAQDAVATRILADLADEQAWEVRFDATSAEQWKRLADMARQEIAAGDTVPLEEAFPVKVTDR